MRCVLSILSLLLLVSCATAGTSVATGDAARPIEGTYEFSASTPNQLIRGSVFVGPEETRVQFETTCQPEATVRPRPRSMPSSTSVMTYYCGGTWLAFDRRNPAAANWFASVEVPRRREVCARYETQNGRQVCVSRTTETYSVFETRTGSIQVRRIS